MAWYWGKFKCGCEGRVNVIGPQKDRQWKVDKRFSELCHDCYEKQLNRKKDEQNRRSLEKAMEMELPQLKGSERQVAWAVTLRQKFIEEIDMFVEGKRDKWEAFIEYKRFEKLKTPEDMLLVRDYIIENKLEASYYIDNRDTISIEVIALNIDEVIKTEQELIKEKELNDINLEATVFPENSVTNVIAEINIKEDTVTVAFEKDYRAIKIVRDLGFKWTGTWDKTINELTGSAMDRAAEVGNKLLNAGFPIRIIDKDVREKAIQGIYKKECNRWVMVRKDGEYKGRMAIKWWEKNDKLYNAARRLPGSKWSSGAVVVRVEHYKEIEEFAELYQFEFTKKAIEHIEEYKDMLKNIDIVKPVEVEKEILKDGLQEILNSSREVLDDLKD